MKVVINKHSLFLALALSFVGCSRQTEKTVWQYFPHMANTPILKPGYGYDGFGNGSGMLMPPEHTIARGHKPYRFATIEEAETKFVSNPVVMTKANLLHGKKLYDTYCFVCHGERGYGDGPIVNPFPIPKPLQSDNMLKWNDGHLFHVITKGQGVMPAYAQQLQPEERWAVIRYVRVLQRAEHPTEEDLREWKKISAK